jgi:hypothetical protein
MLNNNQAHNHTVHGYLQAHRTDPSQGVSTVQPDACLHSHNSLCYVTHTITRIVMTTVIVLMIQFTAAINKRIAVVACIININMTSQQQCNNICLAYPRCVTQNILYIAVFNTHARTTTQQLSEHFHMDCEN